MLTSIQREKCRQLAQTLDQGDIAAYKQAEPSLSREERLTIFTARTNFAVWSELGRQMTAGKQVQVVEGGRGMKKTPKTKSSEGLPKRDTAMRSLDLDYWPPDIVGEDDEADDSPVCPACAGSGKAEDGSVCEECDGSGRVSPSDDEDDDDEPLKDD